MHQAIDIDDSELSEGRPQRPSVTLEQLRVFCAVAELEHVTAAAARLGMAQGSVSMLIRRLEAGLRLPLFDRVGRRVRLTDAGHVLRPIAARMLEDASRIEQLPMRYRDLEHGQLLIAAGRVVGAHRLPSWLAPFALDHPHLTIRIALTAADQLLPLLETGKADVIFVGSHIESPGIESIALERTEIVLVVSSRHPLAASADPLRELHRYRHLQHEAHTATRSHTAAALGDRGELALTVELEEGALHAALVAGLGFALMPRAVVGEDIASGRLVVLPLPGPSVVQEFSAARRSGAPGHARDAIWAYLGSVAATATHSLKE
jgi:DNA-binding transcriptional LysR family regulator